MEWDNRRLGWIAVGLSALALIIAITGRMDSRPAPQVMWGYAPQQGYVVPQAPQAPQVAPQAPQAPQAMPMYGDGWQGRGPWTHDRGHGMMFFAPFMFVGGLIKLLFFGGLIMLALRFFRGRRHGPWGRGPGHGPWGEGRSGCGGKREGEHDETRDPPSEPGASTGSTVKL